MSHLLGWAILMCAVSSKSVSTTDHLAIYSPFLQVLAREDGCFSVSGGVGCSRSPEKDVLDLLYVCHIISQSFPEGIEELCCDYARFSKFNWTGRRLAPSLNIERFGGFFALDLLGLSGNIHNPLNALAPPDELGVRLMAARGRFGFASMCHRLTAITRL